MGRTVWSELERRRKVVSESPDLERLGKRLRESVEPLLDGAHEPPGSPALFAGYAGFCDRDGARLRFDPDSPHAHPCPECGTVFTRPEDHQAWILRYQLWLSDRALRAAVLGVLNEDSRLRDAAMGVVEAYAQRYMSYPNTDNVLGPSRPFFSTYLESIWLAQLAAAVSLLRAGGLEISGNARRMLEESARLIASFDELASNRQVWNNTALIAAGVALDNERVVSRGWRGPHGIRWQIEHCLDEDGFWFEGENYHFFAARGLQLAAELLRATGRSLENTATRHKLVSMYSAPLLTLLPDLTLPARADSPFRVSLCQERFAEFFEVGFSRTGDERLALLLNTLYGTGNADPAPFERVHISELEQNHPPTRLDRSCAGWRGLLWMVPELPPASGPLFEPGARRFGAGVLVRPTVHSVIVLECRGDPGGHGHPDLLNLTFFDRRPIFSDPGTGSYLSSSLAWYRSSLAHNAPAPTGRNQAARLGSCIASGLERGIAWLVAECHDFAGTQSRCRRSVIWTSDWMLDVVDVTVPREMSVDLPLHLPGPFQLSREASAMASAECAAVKVTLPGRTNEELLVERGPAPPTLDLADGQMREFLVRRARGSGRWVQLYTEPGSSVGVRETGPAIEVTAADRSRDTVEVDTERLTVHRAHGGGITISLPATDPAVPLVQRPPVYQRITCPRLAELPEVASWMRSFERPDLHRLGKDSYRRSEFPYAGVKSFSAVTAFCVVGSRVCYLATVTKPQICAREPDAPAPDNESPDINSDGIQCYLDFRGPAGCIAVPAGDGSVRFSPIGERNLYPVDGTWAPTEDGYSMIVTIDTGREMVRGTTFLANLVVNELNPGRRLRSGQLVMTGGTGWVYLRGDREPNRYEVTVS